MGARRTACSLAVLLAAGLSLCAPAHGAVAETYEAPARWFDIGETGELSHFGISVEIFPQTGRTGITGFLVRIAYRDPTYRDSPEVEILPSSFFPVSCSPPRGRLREQPFTWHNTRDIGFAVTLFQDCRRLEPGLAVPFLEAKLWCSDPLGETKYLALMEEGRLFDIVATGFSETVETEVGRSLAGLQVTYNLVSTILTVFDVVAVSRGTITAGKFVMRLVVGVTVDELVNRGLEYARTQHGYEVRFNHTGWKVRCRLCGTVFHVDELTDGQVLSCPNSTCIAESIIHFR